MSALLPFASRLDQLRELRDRVDAEIAEEERRLARIDRARAAAFPTVRQTADEQTLPPAAVIRSWALSAGLSVSQRGPLTSDVVRAYVATHLSA